MIAAAVLAYLATTVGLGVYASRRVRGVKDFMVAGRSLPLYMNFTCVFATWFGAETVLAVSATFAQDGLVALPGDPLGFSVCLVLVAVFFAKVFYRMDLLTIGDFYRKRYGKPIEVITSVVIAASYLGWAAAQLTALGLVLSVLGQNAGYDWLTLDVGIMAGAVIVMVYTVVGGMWSVALTDMIQTVVIVIGLIVIAVLLSNMAGGATNVVATAYRDGKLQMFPNTGRADWLVYIAGFLTAALGSIPQQDVFQRVTSAKDERTAVRGTLLGGIFYFLFAFVPMFIAYCAVVIDADMLTRLASGDEREVQRILPQLIMDRTPFSAQSLFLGALLSAILSTASGTLLAPSSLLVENVIRPFTPTMSDQRMLLILRTMLVIVGVAAVTQAVGSNETMYQMVQNAYSVPLVGALVPLVAGIYWRRSNSAGAFASIVCGIAVWLVVRAFAPQWMIPPQLCGLTASAAAMVIGSLMFDQWTYYKSR